MSEVFPLWLTDYLLFLLYHCPRTISACFDRNTMLVPSQAFSSPRLSCGRHSYVQHFIDPLKRYPQMFVPNGTLFVCFPARVTVGTLGFLLSIAATILQFTMLSSNFAVRFAAVRGYDRDANLSVWAAKEPSNRVKDEGTDLSFVAQEDFRGWMKDYLTNHFLFYGIQFTTALGAYIPLITLMSPTPELRYGLYFINWWES